MPFVADRLSVTDDQFNLLPSLCARCPGGPYGPELEFWDLGETVVIGIDEAGRGPLAGPVVTAAVAFKASVVLDGIGDSKEVQVDTRERLFDQIQERSLSWAITSADPDMIDQVNILEATRRAMVDAARAVASELRCDNPVLLVDGLLPPFDWGRQHNLVKGDRFSFSIGAASILAKVHRDRLMAAYDDEYPGYDFSHHKGYPTPHHRRLLRELGCSPIHRRSYHTVDVDTGERLRIGELPPWREDG